MSMLLLHLAKEPVPWGCPPLQSWLDPLAWFGDPFFPWLSASLVASVSTGP